jgi:hypothetical protein
VRAVCVQPAVASQASFVQASLSLQSGTTSAQRPASQAVVQRGPHSNGLPPAHGVQVSSTSGNLQRFASRSQVSAVHTFVSVQSLVAKQQFRIAVCVQPTPSVQTSVVQASLSEQFGGVSGWQTPAWHVAGLQVVPHGVSVSGVVGPHRFALQVPLLVHGLLSMSAQSSFVWQQFGFEIWTQWPS